MYNDRSNSVEKQNHSEARPVVPKKPRKLPPVAKSNLYKTKMCRNFMDTGRCKYGRVCQFAHSKAELKKYSCRVCWPNRSTCLIAPFTEGSVLDTKAMNSEDESCYCCLCVMESFRFVWRTAWFSPSLMEQQSQSNTPIASVDRMSAVSTIPMIPSVTTQLWSLFKY